jgi:hypothetical protein
MTTIAEEQAKLQQWYEEWLGWEGKLWRDKTPESLIDYLKARQCWELGPLQGETP